MFGIKIIKHILINFNKSADNLATITDNVLSTVDIDHKIIVTKTIGQGLLK